MGRPIRSAGRFLGLLDRGWMSTLSSSPMVRLMYSSTGPLAVWLLAAGAVLSGCMGPDVDPAADADTGSTHAFISVDHRKAGQDTQATAFAGFAQMPATVDSQAVLALVGWTQQLPDPGTCIPVEVERDPNLALAPIGRVEFLEVGDVVVQAGKQETRLAPRAFPGMGDVVTGVLYTSRDPSEEPLEPGVDYTIRTGGSALPPLEVQGAAPLELRHVTVGGVPLETVATVELEAPIDLTWEVGAPSDLLYVELASTDGLHEVVCAFDDSSGAGTIAEGSYEHAGPGTITAHRVRSLGIDEPNIQGELRFNVEQTAEITYRR